MAMSDDELKAKFDEYDAAGKFAYFQLYNFEEMRKHKEIGGRLMSFFHQTDHKNMHDFMASGITTEDLPHARNTGQVTLSQFQHLLTATSTFIYEHGNQNWHSPAIQDILNEMPTFKGLYESGELDAYLEKGQNYADEYDPYWRKKLGLPPKQQPVIKNSPDEKPVPEMASDLNQYEKDAGVTADQLEYLKYFTIDDTVGKYDKTKEQERYLSVRTYKALKFAEIQNQHDLRMYSMKELKKFRGFGANATREVSNWVRETNGLLVSVDHGDYHWPELVPANYAHLQKNHEIKSYLQKGNDKTDARFPNWRAELGLANTQQPVAVTEKDTAKEEFIIEYIAKSVNRIGRSFETRLDQVHPLFGGEIIKELNGKTNAEGETLDFLGDLVLAGRKNLIESFGVNEDQIAILDKTLPMYRLSLDMRDNAEEAYQQKIGQTDKVSVSDDVLRQNGKTDRFKRHFTAP